MGENTGAHFHLLVYAGGGRLAGIGEAAKKHPGEGERNPEKTGKLGCDRGEIIQGRVRRLKASGREEQGSGGRGGEAARAPVISQLITSG